MKSQITKKIGLALIALIGLCVSMQAQTTPTNTMSVPKLLGNIWDTVVGGGLTNLTVAGYGTYTSSLHKWGGGMVLTRNLPIGGGVSTGLGGGFDEYDSNWYGVTAQVGLNASTRPLAGWGGFATNIIMTPFTYIGLGTPFGSSSTTSGQLETIAAVGDMVYLGKFLSAEWNIGGSYGTRTGLGAASGTFYGALFSATWRF